MKEKCMAVLFAVLALCFQVKAATVTMSADEGGTVKPSFTATVGSSNELYATLDLAYQFKEWVVLGNPENCEIQDVYENVTNVTVNGDCSIHGKFEPFPVYTPQASSLDSIYEIIAGQQLVVSPDKKIGKDSEVRFSINIPDTGWVCINFYSSKDNAVDFSNYELDESFVIKKSITLFDSTFNGYSNSHCYNGGGYRYWTLSNFRQESGLVKINPRLMGTAIIEDSIATTYGGKPQAIAVPSSPFQTPGICMFPIEIYTNPYFRFSYWSKSSSPITMGRGDYREMFRVSSSKTVYRYRMKADIDRLSNSSYDVTLRDVVYTDENTVCADFIVRHKRWREKMVWMEYTPWLDTSVFLFDFENEKTSYEQEFTPTKNFPDFSVSTVFLLDGGLRGRKPDNYIHGMRKGDSVAFVSSRKNGEAAVFQSLTSDKVDLYNAEQRVSMYGGIFNNIGAAAMLGLEQLEKTKNKRSMVITTRSSETIEAQLLESILKKAKELNVSINVLADSANNESQMKYLAEQTGGVFSLWSSTTKEDIAQITEGVFDGARYSRQTGFTRCYPFDRSILQGGTSKMRLALDSRYIPSSDAWEFDIEFPKVRDDDVEDRIRVFDSKSDSTILRDTDLLSVLVETQNFADDSLLPYLELPVTIKCAASGDSETVMLPHVKNGLYQIDSFHKNEKEGVVGDGVLSCLDKDTIIATYMDPAYHFEKQEKTVERYVIEDSVDNWINAEALVITSGQESFVITIHSTSASIYEIDTLKVLAFTDQGDSLWIDAVETGPYTSEFIATGKFFVVNDSAEMRKDRLEGLVDPMIADNKWHVNLEMQNGDVLGSFVVEFTNEEFGKDSVANDDSSLKEENVIPADSLQDKIGAVPVMATKFPGIMDDVDFLDGKIAPPLDTLVVVLSEPLINVGKDSSWKDLFTYSKKCQDEKSKILRLDSKPRVDASGLEWTLLIPRDMDIRVNSCIRLNPEASYSDSAGNKPGVGGVSVGGNDGVTYLYDIAATPAISGSGKNVRWINLESGEWEDLPDSISTVVTQTKASYRANVYIFDNIGHVVATFKHSFGKNGELTDPTYLKDENATRLGFIPWNQRSDDGLLVGSGVYIWKIQFVFADGHKETRTLKTGIRRKRFTPRTPRL